MNFEYEPETAERESQQSVSEIVRLPSDLLGRLRRAAEVYSVTEFENYLEEVEALGEREKQLAYRLRELSRNVQIDEILAELHRVEGRGDNCEPDWDVF